MPTMSDNEVDVDDKDDIDLISSSLTLPNGIIISNRLAKVYLYPLFLGPLLLVST